VEVVVHFTFIKDLLEEEAFSSFIQDLLEEEAFSTLHLIRLYSKQALLVIFLGFLIPPLSH